MSPRRARELRLSDVAPDASEPRASFHRGNYQHLSRRGTVRAKELESAATGPVTIMDAKGRVIARVHPQTRERVDRSGQKSSMALKPMKRMPRLSPSDPMVTSIVPIPSRRAKEIVPWWGKS